MVFNINLIRPYTTLVFFSGGGRRGGGEVLSEEDCEKQSKLESFNASTLVKTLRQELFI